MESTYVAGDWNILCDVCSKKIKASKSKHRWDGLIVCPEDFEVRHIQEFLKVRADKISVPFVSNPEDVQLNSACSIPGRHPYAGFAVVGCAEIGYALYSPAELIVAFPIL